MSQKYKFVKKLVGAIIYIKSLRNLKWCKSKVYHLDGAHTTYILLYSC